MGVIESNIWLWSYKEKHLEHDFHGLVSYIECLSVDFSIRSLRVYTLPLTGVAKNVQKDESFISYSIDKVLMLVHGR